MVMALLAALVLWCLFYGQLDPWPLGCVSAFFGLLLALVGRHQHGGVLSIDELAHRSGLCVVNPALKTWGCLLLLLLCICSDGAVGLLLCVLLLLLQLFAGGYACMNIFRCWLCPPFLC
jgi:hypothetical protein